MILTEIFIPALNRTCDFRLNENACIADVLEELGEILRPRKEQGEENVSDFMLCSYEMKKILPLNRTLRQEGIENGCRLVLL